MATQSLLHEPASVCDQDQPTVPMRNAAPKDAPATPLQAPLEPTPTPQRRSGPIEELAHVRTDAFAGSPEQYQLFRELYQHDPEAADRLAWALRDMPKEGEGFFGFRLLAEIGRGGLGRVYLAEQEELAHRGVVLKIAPSIWGEAATLAQMQHSNIVPIFSAHEFEPFQAVCMPYLGWTTFQDLLREIQALPALPTSGQAIVRAFRPAPVPELPQPPAPEFVAALTRMSYVEAIVWLASQLASGLAHAHEHGIVHHDLKPANILLSDDGTPMLLDFNAACDTKPHQGPIVALVAGTLPYLAPEQLASFHKQTLPIDPRCDIYAFGIILFELLTGRYPFKQRHPELATVFDRILEERETAPPTLRGLNNAITPAVEAIVRRCLEPDPDDRYQTARALYEDLQRQHTHRPLRHIAEPSLAERAHKWTRRHPRLFTATVFGLVASLLVSTFGTLWVMRGNQLDRASTLERERIEHQTQRDIAATAWRRFQDKLRTAQFLLYTRTTEPEQLADGVTLGKKLIGSYGALDDADWRDATLVQALPDADRQKLGDAMAEVLLLTARALIVQHVDDATAGQGVFQQALTMNERAADCSPRAATSPGLWQQRARLQGLLGRKGDEAKSKQRSKQLLVRSAADHYWLASDHVTAGRLRAALPLLQKATQLEPANFWAWFVLGNCCDRLGMDARAEACYATCIALNPDFHWSYFNRGLALYRQQDYRAACADFDKVLTLRPDVGDAFLNRALARQGLQQYREAEEDLTKALDFGGPSRLYFLRARMRDKLGNKAGAQADIAEAMRRPPQDEKSWIARGIHQLHRDPKAALADFEEALRINPRSADALQNKAHVLAEKLGRNKDSLQSLDRLVELYPDSVKARNGRGVVLARLGQREAAIRDAEETLRRDASPPRLYQVACIYALTSAQQPDDRLQAFQLLSSALRKGYGTQYLDIDTDLDPIRNHSEFRRLTDAAHALALPTKK